MTQEKRVKGKGLHIANSILVGIAFLLFAAMFLVSVIMTVSKGSFADYFSDVGNYIIIVGGIVSGFYFFMLLGSSKKCNIDNPYFKWAGWIDIVAFAGTFLAIIISIISMISTAYSNPSAMNSLQESVSSFFGSFFGWFNGILFPGSFILFLLGYFKYKKNN